MSNYLPLMNHPIDTIENPYNLICFRSERTIITYKHILLYEIWIKSEIFYEWCRGLHGSGSAIAASCPPNPGIVITDKSGYPSLGLHCALMETAPSTYAATP